MYVWIWRHLPGNVALRIGEAALLIALVAALLLFVVFPWIEPKLWFTHVTVSQ
jgi:hypothetical protein